MKDLHPMKKDNPKLMQKLMSDGRYSLYLQFYFGYDKVQDPNTGKEKIKHKRKKEVLELYVHSKPRTPEERESNRQTLALAKSIRQRKEDELKSKKLNITDRNKNKINFIDFADQFLKNYINKDVRIVKYCVSYLRKFILLEQGKEYILPVDINERFGLKFKKYLEENLNGETPHNYFTKFKKICKEALEEGLPVDKKIAGIKNKRNEGLKKDILTIEEINLLATTELKNKEVKRAFLFCLNTGLRFCDVKILAWDRVSGNQVIIKSQEKTDKPVYIDLNKNAIQLMGSKGKADELIFNLPSLTSCLKQLKTWASRAGIEKNLTWHSSRHSFAVNLLIYKTDIKTVSSLLGHAGLKHTEKYTRVVDRLKREAVDSLPNIDF